MKTRQRTRRQRTFGSQVRRSSPQWEEYDPTGSDYKSDNLRDDRFSHGYHNTDYIRKNFWPASKDEDRAYYDQNEPTGFFESEHEEYDEAPGFRTVGYGNENSQFAEDFNRRKYGDPNRYNAESNVNRGYKRKRDNEPNPYYSDKYYFNPSHYDRNGYRKNPESDTVNQYAEETGPYGYPEEYDENIENFGGYQSYPSYRQGPEGYDRYGRRHLNELYEEDRKEGGEYKRSRRPSIREKRY